MANDNQVKIYFVGTGSAQTCLKRFYTSFLIFNNNTNLLIDCGDGISRKLKELQIDNNKIDNILLTHLHPDHFSGLATLIVQMKLGKRIRPLNIFIHEDLKKFLEKYLEQIYLFKNRLSFKLNLITYSYQRITLIDDNFSFVSKQNSHLNKYLDTDSKSLINLISPSFVFNVSNKKIFYSSDIGNKNDLYLFDFKCDISILETTHIELSDILDFVREEFYSQYFLVHIKEDQEESIYKYFSDEISKNKVFIPDDGDEYSI